VSLDAARSVADAVLYEGYLLYPYRATSAKNQMRWQFGVLGPPAAWRGGVGEEPTMHAELLVRDLAPRSRVGLHLRFLQLQARGVDQVDVTDPSVFRSADALVVGETTLLPWDEAVEQDVALGPFELSSLRTEISIPIGIAGREEIEVVTAADGTTAGGTIAGRIVRRCWPLAAEVRLRGQAIDDHPGVLRLSVEVENTSPAPAIDRDEAIRYSFLGAHLLLEATDADFISLLEPPPHLAATAAACQNRRCWPVLTGTQGDTDTVLVSPIILYDYPAVAPESAGALFDSTEIDEILTLRVLALTDEEKAVARATDPAAAAIIDRCEQMSPEAMQQLHGVLRHPHLGGGDPSPFDAIPTFTTPATGPLPDSNGAPWWDPGVDGAVSPSHDSVTVAGVEVAKGSLVRLRPSRRADAQDLFFAGQVATVSAVYFDVDGETHVAVVLVDDPAADLHEWYGRYLYFSPDEIEPLDGADQTSTGGDQPWHS
jgi:hypothetical protein